MRFDSHRPVVTVVVTVVRGSDHVESPTSWRRCIGRELGADRARPTTSEGGMDMGQLPKNIPMI